MPDKLIRGFSDDEANILDTHAQAAGMNFQQWAKETLLRAASGPALRYGYKGIADNGAQITIRREGDSGNNIGGGAHNMSQEQADAYKNAQLLIGRNNPGDRERATKLLQDVGFELFEVRV